MYKYFGEKIAKNYIQKVCSRHPHINRNTDQSQKAGDGDTQSTKPKCFVATFGGALLSSDEPQTTEAS